MILVLTPLAFENQALCAHLGPDTGGLICATGGHGKVQFALTAQKLIGEHAPHLVICAGAGGALMPGLSVGDVVAAENTIEHDFNLRFEKRPLPRFAGDSNALAILRAENTWPGFRLHFGTVASGDEDIVDPTRAGAIRMLTEGLAVAWEGAGGARAAAFCKTPYLELRVITDTADESASRDFRRNVQAGMKNVAAVLRRLL